MPELNKQDLQSLLSAHLGKDLLVESFTSKPLTKAGDNYGSTMLAIEVTIREGASSRNLSLVAKLVPPSEFLWKVFDPPNTVCKEINCYVLVKEEFKKLQIEKNVPNEKFCDVFPECYGARTTLSGEIGDKADKDAAILLQNLKTANYHLGDRTIGLDLNHVHLAVSKLARFHALSVALKTLKPQVFKNTVMKACKPHVMNFTEEEMMANIPKQLHYIKAIPECAIYFDKLKKASEIAVKENIDKSLLPAKEPYATMYHVDFWVNNMMFHYDSSNNVPDDIKFVDFQGVLYSSPVKDLIFFLYTSAAKGVVANHYGDIIHLYHENFTDCLKSVGCDTRPFSFQSFLKEIDEFAPSEIDHILFMLTFICADKTDIPEQKDADFKTIYREPNETLKWRAKEVVLDFVQRGWL